MEKIYRNFFKKDENENHSIVPSKEFVNNLLRKCTRELGIEYNPEEEKEKRLFSEEQENMMKEIKGSIDEIKRKSKIRIDKFF